MDELVFNAIKLLQQLISAESISKSEDKTAEIIEQFFESSGVRSYRHLNNVWVKNKYFDPAKPTILLNSHHDTVKPSSKYTRDPFDAKIENGILYGLGSSDAGGALVSLLSCFLFFCGQRHLKFNLVFAATAEEEISGKNGIESLLPLLPDINLGVVGEPTQMQIAIAEKGLMVVDCESLGVSGHAAREEGDNAIYNALKDIEWFRTYRFPKISEKLGPVKMNVTVISAGTQHNVVPESCLFTVDVRTTDAYSNKEVLDFIRQNVRCKVTPRSTRLNPSSINAQHPLVKAGVNLGRELYGSPTTSDQALMNFPTIKMGPGDSARSHSANEYIHLHEIEEAIALYIKLLTNYDSMI